MKSFGRGAILALWLGAAISGGEAAEVRRALLIGNDAYAVRPLYTCINDARAMSAWLQTVGYEPQNVRLLTNAGRTQMQAALQELADQCRRQRARQVVVYYSGHGMPLDDDDGDEGPEDRQDEAFVGVFADRVESADEIVIRDDEFHTYVRQLRGSCDQLVLIYDSCFSGGSTKDLDGAAVKAIREADVVRGAANRSAGDKSLPAARDIQRDRETAALSEADPQAGQLLILTACNQFQTAQAGHPPQEPLSRFTAALLQAVEAGRTEGELSLLQLRQRLTATLNTVPQTPDVVPVGLDADAPFIPGVFKLATAAVPRREVAELLHQLLTLPQAGEQPWNLEVRATKPEPLAVGTKFALQVTTSHDGFLVIATVETSGRVAVQFPNRYRMRNDIAANKPTVVPYPDAFQARPPAGEERFLVFLLETNPFDNFDFSKHEGALVVGQLQDVLSWYPELAKSLDVKHPRESLVRGMEVEPTRQPAADNRPPPPGWVRKMVTLETVP